MKMRRGKSRGGGACSVRKKRPVEKVPGDKYGDLGNITWTKNKKGAVKPGVRKGSTSNRIKETGPKKILI